MKINSNESNGNESNNKIYEMKINSNESNSNESNGNENKNESNSNESNSNENKNESNSNESNSNENKNESNSNESKNESNSNESNSYKFYITEAVGWVGSILVLIPYVITLNKTTDFILNTLGASGLFIVCVTSKQYQSIVINAAWIIGGIYKYFS
jgi:DNA mismatch repair ATPase MutL